MVELHAIQRMAGIVRQFRREVGGTYTPAEGHTPLR